MPYFGSLGATYNSVKGAILQKKKKENLQVKPVSFCPWRILNERLLPEKNVNFYITKIINMEMLVGLQK